MFDIGWTELLLIAIVALIVVGPKDLPGMFRTLGRFTAKAKSMAREFSRAMEDAVKETGVKEAADGLKAATTKKNLGLDALEDAAKKFEKWDPMKPKPASSATGPATMPGPATQEMINKQVEEAGARAKAAAGKAAATKAADAKAADATPAVAKPAAKVTARPKAAAKPKAAAPKAASKPASKAASKPGAAPRKAASKKGTA